MDRRLGWFDGGGCVRAAGIANEGVGRGYDQDDTCDERHGNNPDVSAPVARKERMVHRRFRRLQPGVLSMPDDPAARSGIGQGRPAPDVELGPQGSLMVVGSLESQLICNEFVRAQF
jgi:hypothetical protein